jgi:hypothetical protein
VIHRLNIYLRFWMLVFGFQFNHLIREVDVRVFDRPEA